MIPIYSYMKSKTRKYIDDGQAYVCTLDSKELWDYFCKTDGYEPQKGASIGGFCVNWIGQFYAYFQWYYNIASEKVVELVPLDFIRAAYYGLHDMELDLAVNWYLSKFEMDGMIFSSMEQYMMYQKAVTFQDCVIAKEILNTNDVSEMKTDLIRINGKGKIYLDLH